MALKLQIKAIYLVSMLQGINILEFFDNGENRRWDDSDVKDFIVTFRTGQYPAFTILTDDAGVAGTFYIRNAETEEIIKSGNLVVTASSDKNLLSYYGATDGLDGYDPGYYYYELNFNGNTYRSDVWAANNVFTDYVKIGIESSNLTLSGEHEIPVSLYSELSFYLFNNGITIESEIIEDGVEKPYGDIPVFTTANIIRKVEINGTAQIYRMLSSLRAFNVNGRITISSVHNSARLIYNTNTEIIEDSDFGKTVIFNLTYKEIDFLSSRNEI